MTEVTSKDRIQPFRFNHEWCLAKRLIMMEVVTWTVPRVMTKQRQHLFRKLAELLVYTIEIIFLLIQIQRMSCLQRVPAALKQVCAETRHTIKGRPRSSRMPRFADVPGASQALTHVSLGSSRNLRMSGSSLEGNRQLPRPLVVRHGLSTG